eukprot:Rmarinus@m.20975
MSGSASAKRLTRTWEGLEEKPSKKKANPFVSPKYPVLASYSSPSSACKLRPLLNPNEPSSENNPLIHIQIPALSTRIGVWAMLRYVELRDNSEECVKQCFREAAIRIRAVLDEKVVESAKSSEIAAILQECFTTEDVEECFRDFADDFAAQLASTSVSSGGDINSTAIAAILWNQFALKKSARRKAGHRSVSVFSQCPLSATVPGSPISDYLFFDSILPGPDFRGFGLGEAKLQDNIELASSLARHCAEHLFRDYRRCIYASLCHDDQNFRAELFFRWPHPTVTDMECVHHATIFETNKHAELPCFLQTFTELLRQIRDIDDDFLSKDLPQQIAVPSLPPAWEPYFVAPILLAHARYTVYKAGDRVVKLFSDLDTPELPRPLNEVWEQKEPLLVRVQRCKELLEESGLKDVRVAEILGACILSYTYEKSVEQITSAHFRSLFQRLAQLHARGLVYGDLRFANVVFGVNHKAYLIDMDMVGINSKTRYVSGYKTLSNPSRRLRAEKRMSSSDDLIDLAFMMRSCKPVEKAHVQSWETACSAVVQKTWPAELDNFPLSHLPEPEEKE